MKFISTCLYHHNASIHKQLDLLREVFYHFLWIIENEIFLYLTNLYLKVESERRLSRLMEHQRASKDLMWQDCTRQQHFPGHWAAEIDQWKQKFNPINSSEAVRKMSALLSEDTIEISSSSSVLSHLKFIVSNFFCWRRMRWKLAKLKHNYNWFYKLSFLNRLQTIVMLIYWIAWVRSSCMTHV